MAARSPLRVECALEPNERARHRGSCEAGEGRIQAATAESGAMTLVIAAQQSNDGSYWCIGRRAAALPAEATASTPQCTLAVAVGQSNDRESEWGVVIQAYVTIERRQRSDERNSALSTQRRSYAHFLPFFPLALLARLPLPPPPLPPVPKTASRIACMRSAALAGFSGRP